MGAPTVDLYRYERDLRAQGCRRIAGVDETGRGALAGPLVAAAVILPAGFALDGIGDSKGLTANRRNEAYERITTDKRVAWSVCWVEPGTINGRGLDRCNLAVLRRAVHKLDPEPDYVLIDGSRPVRWMRFPAQSIPKGDAVSASIAAASIVAKVTRDRIMELLDKRHPGYGFKHNRGYGAREHFEALERCGITPIHRITKRTKKWF